MGTAISIIKDYLNDEELPYKIAKTMNLIAFGPDTQWDLSKLEEDNEFTRELAKLGVNDKWDLSKLGEDNEF